MTIQVTVTANGRMSIPADIRKRLGLGQGGVVFVSETPDGVILRTVEQTLAFARTLAKQYESVEGASVEDFLRNRVVESGQ